MMAKKLMLLFAGIAMLGNLMAQQSNNYNSNWKKVEAAEKKGLTKTAWAAVNDIYKLAQKDNNDAQQIKACMYLIRYRNMVEDDSKQNNIFFVDTLIRNAKAPAKNILQSMQAEMYWQFVQNNRYIIYNRTKLDKENSKDINTWSLDKLHQTISKLYKASLQNESLLQSTSLEGFEPIIIKGENTRQLRPTLFDFLAFRSLDYFMTDENDLTKPAYEFKLDNPAVFAPAATFAATIFTTKDTASLQLHALQLLQRIIRFHLKDTKPDALLDADLIRLQFVHRYSVIAEKDKLYEVALQQIETRYSSNPASAEAMYRRAKIYFDAASDDEGGKPDPLHQYDIKRAKELCDSATAKFPKSEGGINAANLVKEILRPSLQMETEKVNLPNQPFRSLVKYKNAPVVYFRLVKTSNDEIKKITNNEDDKMWQRITALTALKSWQVDMPDPKDFREHTAEIKADAVGSGTYYLLSSLDKNFSLEKNIITSQIIYVSSIASISNQRDYYVLNRETGQPLAKAAVQVWENKYNSKTGNYENIKAETYSTDNNGFFKLVSKKENRNISLQIKTATDELHLLSNDYDNGYYDGDYQTAPIKPVSFLFTDRSIYRPGQTVYFKGIVIKTDKDANKNSVLPGYSTVVFLKDANGQKIQELKMTTNDYGSYHGSFKLPEGSLNGNFSITDTSTNGYQNFNVEEYKRPKFSVEVQKPEGSYRVNDSITVTGTAKAYAGNNVDGAAVKYRVVRRVQYPIWWDYGFRKGGRYPYGRRDEMEITNGVTTTDADGKFKLTFKALPDESISKKDQPTFYYEVSADVTDINGESRSGETSVAVAYQALQLEIKLADKLPADSLKTILVRSTNLNDLEEKTTATVTIEKLKSPGKIFRERYWEEPDQFVMSQQEYYSYFPFDVYKNEDEVKHYPVGEKVFEKTDSSNREWSMVNGEFKAGWYKITATTKDKFGEEVKSEKYIQLTDEKKAGTENAIDVQVTKLAEPGEKVRYNIKTGFDKIRLIQTVSKMNDRKVTSYVDVAGGKPLEATETVTDIDRGGIAINYVFIKNNRVYKGNEVIDIPWSNKELNISYSTFRDKLLPGAKETLTVKISGSKGDKVAAEILAGMYDASLDQFRNHSWNRLPLWPNLYSNFNWDGNGFQSIEAQNFNTRGYDGHVEVAKTYDHLGVANPATFQYRNRTEPLWWINPLDYAYGDFNNPKHMKLAKGNSELYDAVGNIGIAYNNTNFSSNVDLVRPSLRKDDAKHMKLPKPVFDDTDGDGIPDQLDKEPTGGLTSKPEIQLRKNFNETAFFFPDLKTDADGNVSFSFTIPEALTKWKLLTLAHTKDAASGYTEKTLVTQKPLMVQPNAPRFMREGDNMEFSAKIVNLSDSEITGTATLELLDAATNKPVDGWFKNVFPNQYFTVAAGQSAAIKFPMEIPFNFNSAMTYRITAASSPLSSKGEPVPTSREGVGEATAFSDGEENSLPILTNRMLVTESLPINLRNTDKKDFKFEKLLNSGSSQTIANHALTVEFSSNPAWYAVQALPYLMEYPYECAEQTFNRLYANILAGYVTNSMPKIKAMFDRWSTGGDSTALLSNLQKNEELKAALLEETPWVMDAQNEAQQKKNIALLFDMTRMAAAQEKAFAQLKEMQSENGGFVWFKGGPDDRYITQYIITGIGHLLKLKAISPTDYKLIQPVVAKALVYLDKKIKGDYDNLVKYKAKLSNNNLSYTAIQYLYMRSFFKANGIAAASQKAVEYYVGQSKKFWLSQSKYMQAMIALSAFRMSDSKTAKAIIASLKENSISNEEMGMYWKDWADGGGYYWHQAPIESQAMMIEAFTDIDGNTATINDLKTWLLKQKQTQNWRTTKATAEACYALLLQGSNWLAEDKTVTIQLGNTTISSNTETIESGTGYFKKKIEAKDVQPAMGNISVSINQSTNKPANQSSSWGSVYWQYFEDLDKITPSATPLKIVKKLFFERNSDKGPVLDVIEDGAALKVGDKIKVRIELRVDRDMEYLHMKDMRAACMEPVNVLSGYKYQDGLGYYESTKDASTNFFFNQVNKGTYVFEYSLFVTHAGNFSNGITSIQCMYAPEFNSHSEGIRVRVE